FLYTQKAPIGTICRITAARDSLPLFGTDAPFYAAIILALSTHLRGQPEELCGRYCDSYWQC
ncbi:MAG: hypothetical protein ACI87Q_002630, partial [Pseudohongiellaceae bacterium]